MGGLVCHGETRVLEQIDVLLRQFHREHGLFVKIDRERVAVFHDSVGRDEDIVFIIGGDGRRRLRTPSFLSVENNAFKTGIAILFQQFEQDAFLRRRALRGRRDVIGR